MPFGVIPKSAFKKGFIPWNKGKTGVYSKETIEKMTFPHIGKKLSLEHKMKISKGNMGRKCDSLTRKKISLANTGKKRSEETKMKLRILNLGKRLSPETCKKMSKSRMGRRFSQETIEKIRISNLGRKVSPETRERIRIANRKKANDPKILEKIRQARLKQVFPTRNSKPERMMQIALSLNGIKFEKHKPILGQPDIFIEPNICIFVDGDYWHANPDKYSPDFVIAKKQYRTAKEIWAYDTKVNHMLNEQGYQVIRIWDHVIRKDANMCAERVIALINQTVYGSTHVKLPISIKGD